MSSCNQCSQSPCQCAERRISLFGKRGPTGATGPAGPTGPATTGDGININGLVQATTTSYAIIAGATTAALSTGRYLFWSVINCNNIAALGALVDTKIYSEFFLNGVASGEEMPWWILANGAAPPQVQLVQYVSIANMGDFTFVVPTTVDLRVKHIANGGQVLKARLQYIKIG